MHKAEVLVQLNKVNTDSNDQCVGQPQKHTFNVWGNGNTDGFNLIPIKAGPIDGTVPMGEMESVENWTFTDTHMASQAAYIQQGLWWPAGLIHWSLKHEQNRSMRDVIRLFLVEIHWDFTAAVWTKTSAPFNQFSDIKGILVLLQYSFFTLAHVCFHWWPLLTCTLCQNYHTVSEFSNLIGQKVLISCNNSTDSSSRCNSNTMFILMCSFLYHYHFYSSFSSFTGSCMLDSPHSRIIKRLKKGIVI